MRVLRWLVRYLVWYSLMKGKKAGREPLRYATVIFSTSAATPWRYFVDSLL